MRTYRNNGTYRDGRFDYRGNAASTTPRIQIFARNPIGASDTPRFKLEEATLPGGRTATRIVKL